MKKYELEIKVRIDDQKQLTIGKTYTIFGQKRVAAGFISGAIAFVNQNPAKADDAHIWVYTASEVAEFYESGDIKGLENID